MIVVTVLLLIMNQIDFRLVHNQKENCHHDQIPFNLIRIKMYFSACNLFSPRLELCSSAERLTHICIVEAPLKPLRYHIVVMFEGFQGSLSWVPMMPITPASRMALRGVFVEVPHGPRWNRF